MNPQSQSSVPPVSRYLLTWAALLILLTMTLGTAYIPLGAINVTLNLAISVIKTLLVMTVFMHLGNEHPAIRIAAAAGFFFLALLLVLSLADYLTRG